MSRWKTASHCGTEILARGWEERCGVPGYGCGFGCVHVQEPVGRVRKIANKESGLVGARSGALGGMW